MEQRHLGITGLTSSALGLGCMGFSQAYGPADDTESTAVIRDALDCGITMIDTAMSYGRGHNERLVGKAVAGRRQDVVLATKFGIVRGEDGVQMDGRPDHVRGYCEASLERLGVDTIDLYYLHRVDPEVPIAETVSSSRPPRYIPSPRCSSNGHCPGGSPMTTSCRPRGASASGWCRTALSAGGC
jgi:aryl-alcohol dehydrogenase-like predicted oxidoreductase